MTRLAATEIAALDPYTFMAVIGKGVIHPGGRASPEALLARADATRRARATDGVGGADRVRPELSSTANPLRRARSVGELTLPAHQGQS